MCWGGGRKEVKATERQCRDTVAQAEGVRSRQRQGEGWGRKGGLAKPCLDLGTMDQAQA